MARLKGQTVRDSRLPRGLRLVDDDLPEEETAHTAVALPRHTEVPPPASLPERLHDSWREITGALSGSGLMAAADVPTVALLVRELELYTVAADDALREGTTLINERGTPVQNPAYSLANMHANTIAKIAKDLGLNFVARARMSPPEEGLAGHAGAGNPFAV